MNPCRCGLIKLASRFVAAPQIPLFTQGIYLHSNFSTLGLDASINWHLAICMFEAVPNHPKPDSTLISAEFSARWHCGKNFAAYGWAGCRFTPTSCLLASRSNLHSPFFIFPVLPCICILICAALQTLFNLNCPAVTFF